MKPTHNKTTRYGLMLLLMVAGLPALAQSNTKGDDEYGKVRWNGSTWVACTDANSKVCVSFPDRKVRWNGSAWVPCPTCPPFSTRKVKWQGNEWIPCTDANPKACSVFAAWNEAETARLEAELSCVQQAKTSAAMDRCGASREKAITMMLEQADVVLGKARRTKALINDVMTWYEVDPKHPDAVAHAETLREFDTTYIDEYKELLTAFRDFQDRGIFPKELSSKGDDKDLTPVLDILMTALDENKEIESLMRQLRAMGFE